jgi:iron(III) transport system substrate-binding protein
MESSAAKPACGEAEANWGSGEQLLAHNQRWRIEMAKIHSMQPYLKRSTFVAGAVLALMSIGSGLALGQTSSTESVALYQGSDREQRLIEGAKREGGLTVYSSLPQEDNTAIANAFSAKYGIKVNVWRAGSEELLQRVIAESKAGRFDVDVVSNNGAGLEPLHREKLLQEVRSPYYADLLPEAIPPHREWVAAYLNLFVQGYNTDLVGKGTLPAKYEDLLKPEWKGRLGIEAEDFDWFAEVVRSLGESEGLELFRKIKASNGISVRKGHTLLTNLVAAGEVPLALTLYSYSPEQLKQKGAPIEWFVIPPAIARPNGVAVVKNAPRPHAAVLFMDFMVTDAQQILAERNFVPTSTRVVSPYKGPLKIVNSALMLDEAKKWQDLFDSIVVK